MRRNCLTAGPHTPALELEYDPALLTDGYEPHNYFLVVPNESEATTAAAVVETDEARAADAGWPMQLQSVADSLKADLDADVWQNRMYDGEKSDCLCYQTRAIRHGGACRSMTTT